MKKYVGKSVFGVLMAIVLACAAHLSVGAAGGPPQFLTFPILLHVADAALDHGHFVFGGEAAMPAPLSPQQGAASFASASTGSNSIASLGDVDVSNSLSSYEGETGATSAAATDG